MQGSEGGTSQAVEPMEGIVEGEELLKEQQESAPAEKPQATLLALTVVLPKGLGSISVQVPTTALVHDIRQHVIDSPEGLFYTCFHLEFQQKRLFETDEIGSIQSLESGSQLNMIEDPYTEREVRIHVSRFRELLTNFQSTVSTLGIDMGVSYLPTVSDGFQLNTAVAAAPAESSKKPNSKTNGNEKEKKAENTSHAFVDYDFSMAARDSMANLIPKVTSSTEPCLRSVGISPWNPPPANRKLLGDLLYLAVTSLEGAQFHITCSVGGFFINRSTEKFFDPNPRTPKHHLSHTIPGLLAQASAGFQNRFSAIQLATQRRHPYEYLLSPVSLYPWLTRQPQHVPDPGRSLDASLTSADVADLYATRDWNDDLQTAREMPRDTPQDRVLREQAIFRQLAEFADAAARGAVAITGKSLTPLNPNEASETARMYIHGGIFFSYGADHRETFEKYGGVAAAHVAVGKDIDGISLVNNLDVRGLHTLGTAVVDYKGSRIIAQSVVPGILKRQQQIELENQLQEQLKALNKSDAQVPKNTEGGAEEATAQETSAPEISEHVVQYGSIDNGKTISADPVFHQLVGIVAKHLHLDDHEVIDAEGNKVHLYTSLDTKGVTGDDRRRYLLDLARLFPVDILFLDQLDEEEKIRDKQSEGADDLPPAYPHRLTMLRSELVDLFFEYRLNKYVAERRAVYEKKHTETESGDKNDAVVPDAPETPAAPEFNFDLRFNPDAFMTPTEGEETEETKTQNDNIRSLSKFLHDQVIPSIALDLASNPSTPVDGDRLTNCLHSRGVNMRYLGKITKLLDSISAPNAKTPTYAKELLHQEMIARAAKTILRELLADLPLYLVPQYVSRFFNCLYADPASSGTDTSSFLPAPFHTSGLSVSACPPESLALLNRAVARDTDVGAKYEMLTPLWVDQRIREEVHRRFRYPGILLPTRLGGKRKLPLLRSICLKVGIQLESKEREWDSGDALFSADDILNIYPVVKFPEPKSAFGDEVYEHSMHALRQGQNQLGFDLLAETASIYEQVYGPIHPEPFRIYRSLAMIKHEAGDTELSRTYQRKAVIVAERTLGFDDLETVQQYMNLGFFECGAGNFDVGFKYMIHALRLMEMLCAEGQHPELAAVDTQIAMMLMQSRLDLRLASKFLSRAVETNELLLGREHDQTVRSYDHLCQNLMLLGDFRSALDAHRIVFNHLKAKAGDNEEGMKEATATLEFLTQRALLEARRNIAVDDVPKPAMPASGRPGAKGKSKHHPLNGAAAGLTQRGGKGKAATAAEASPAPPNKGHLSVEELLKFIEDGGSSKKKKGSKQSSKN